MEVKEYIAQKEQKTPLQERLKLVRKLFHLAMEINEEGKYYVFFDLQAHVSMIHVHITPSEDYKNWLYDNNFYYDSDYFAHEEMLDNLKQTVSKLIRYLEVKNG